MHRMSGAMSTACAADKLKMEVVPVDMHAAAAQSALRVQQCASMLQLNAGSPVQQCAPSHLRRYA